MLFNSFEFAAFFCTLYVLYLLSMKRRRAQNTLLLVGSYFFYGCWDWRFLSLIVLSTVIDFMCGLALDRRDGERTPNSIQPAYAHSARTRKAVLLLSVVANLGILGFFKYFDFFVASCAELLSTVGLPLQLRLLNVVLPVGISFYTFQTMSYTIDIYRGNMRAHRSLLDFAVFVSFFPQLVAGPIVRAKDFIPQASKPRKLVPEQIYYGSYLILWGLFKKMVIADNLASQVDDVFGASTLPQGGAILIALYAFAVQIYCDFSGYSDIARGCAAMMGFDIRINFNLPYFATNPSDFWRRWHISLSSWLRDYLYIPLGGSHKGPRRTGINLMLTMLLGGLWHGAAWTFVLWGFYQGFLLMAHKTLMPLLQRVMQGWAAGLQRVYKWLAIAVFFHFTCLGWLIFRAESVAQIGDMLVAMLTTFDIRGTGMTHFAIFVSPLILVQLAQYLKNDLNIMLRMPAVARGLTYAIMFYGLVMFGVRVEMPFIYFQF